MSKFTLTLTSILLCLSINIIIAQTALNKSDFQTPPQSTKVHTWWHWMNGNISKEGISKDLESMKQQGIVQASIFDVGLPSATLLDIPKVKFGTAEWYDMFRWSLREANRFGISIGFHNCGGWSQSGGPWITPESSMKQYGWSKTIVDGGKIIKTQLTQPPTRNDFYRDAMVVAFPISEPQNSYQTAHPKVKFNNQEASALSDSNPMSKIDLKKGDSILISFSKLQTINKVAFFPFIYNSETRKTERASINSQFSLLTSSDGITFTKIKDLEFVGINKMIMVEFPETNTKFYKLVCVNCPAAYTIGEIELLKGDEDPSYSPKITNLLEKTQVVSAIQESQLELTTENSQKGIAANSVIDISSFVTPQGYLNWKAPRGRWGIIRFGYTTTGRKNVCSTFEGRGLECDKMDTAALNLHFNSFAGKLIKEAGSYNGNTFKFLLIDSWEAYYQNWTKNFPEEFKKLRAYNITQWIPVLCGETVENTKLSEGFLHDFQLTISDMIAEKYYKHFAELCHKNQLELHAEVIYGNTGEYPFLDVLKSNNYVDMPMTEFWARPNSAQIIKYEAKSRPNPYSIFPQFSTFEGNKKIIGTEAYTGFANYSESPFDLKPFGDEMFCSGINQMILHSNVHQPTDNKPGLTLERYAAHFNRHNPWWEYSQDWLTYQARIQSVLQKGEPVADVVFYIGDKLPQSLSKSIMNNLPYGFTAYPCNFDMLKNKAKVVDGKLSFGGSQKYTLLTLPDKTNMDLSTLKLIAQLVNNGLVLYGPKPLVMLSMQDIKNNEIEFNQLTEKLWGESIENNVVNNKYGKGKVIWGKPIDKILNELKAIPDFTTNQNDPKNIMYFHKKVGDEDVYFVFNQQNRTLNRELLFRMEGKTPEIWNAENGTICSPSIYATEQNQMRIPVTFNPYQSLIFVFKNGKPENFISKVSLAGKQLFPQKLLSDTIYSIPQVSFTNNSNQFSTEQTGNYIFTTNKNELLTKSLTQPTIFTIENFKGIIEFYPIYKDTIQSVEISKLISLTEFVNPKIKYFAGKSKYTIVFDVPTDFVATNDSIVLNLGKIDATAEVRLNGQLLACLWQPNVNIPITNLLKTNNILEVTVANVCRNRFIGDYIQYGSIKSMWTSSPIEQFLNKETSLKPSGLIGPIKLIQYTKQ
ncbi:MAG: glycosyl hydrolase [Bacteroidales bacterium]